MSIPVEDEAAKLVPSLAYIPQKETLIGPTESVISIKWRLSEAYIFLIAGSGVIKVSFSVDKEIPRDIEISESRKNITAVAGSMLEEVIKTGDVMGGPST